MFKKILTVTNGTARCLHAIETATGLALLHGSTLTILVASEFRAEVAAVEGYMLQPDFDRMKDAARLKEAQHLELGLKVARQMGLPEGLLRGVQCDEVDPATAILNKAKILGSDLIVIGSRGRHGLATLLLGSVTADVISGTQLPVLVVK